jgi:YhcH/YjgK/YiaL family protein
MIIDLLHHSDHYSSLSPRIASGLAFLKDVDFGALKLGRNDIEGDSLYAMYQEYDTRAMEQGAWESHRAYADIQFIVEGEELIGYAPLTSMIVKDAYKADGDYALYEGSGDFLHLRAGQFAIFWPQDVHMPGVAVTQPSAAKKVVVKVLL